MKRLIRDYVLAVGSYVAIMVVGLTLTLTISSAVGYLPYSDRPGPGWTEPFFSFELLGFYVGWSVLLLLPSAVYGSVVFAILRLLHTFNAPLILIRVMGALSAGYIALVLAVGIGWYIAMAPFPAFIAAGLGAAWGSIVVPRCLGPPARRRAGWVRWVGGSLVLLVGIGGLYRTFGPRYGQELRFQIVRAMPSADESRVELEPRERAMLDSLLPGVRFDGVMMGTSTNGDTVNRARMLIVITGPVTTEARLRQPKGVGVVYVQRDGEWDMFPPHAPTLKQQFRIGPGSKSNEITFAGPSGEASTFRWPPD